MEVIRRVLAAFMDGEVDTEVLFFRKNPMSVYIMCNDTFYFACADCELVTEENVGRFEQAMADCMAAGDPYGNYGPLLFIARERNLLPLPSILDRIEEPYRTLIAKVGGK